MNWLQQYSKYQLFQKNSHLDALGSKFDLDIQAKGQPCLLPLSENNDFGFNSIQKINFSKFSHLNALGSKI